MAEPGNDHLGKDRLLRYLNVDLPFDEMCAVEAHLNECNECRKKAEKLKPESEKEQIDRNFDKLNEKLEELSKLSGKNIRSFKSLPLIIILIFIAAGSGLAFLSLNGNLKSIFTKKDPNTIGTTETTESAEPLSSSFQKNDISEDVLDTAITELQPDKSESLLKRNELAENNGETVEESQTNQLISKNTSQESNQSATDDKIEEENNEETIEESTLVEEPEPVLSPSISVRPGKIGMPMPVTGFEMFSDYIKNGFKYSDESMENEEQGQVVVLITLDTLNNLSQVQVTEGISQSINNQLTDLVQNGPEWVLSQPDSISGAREGSLIFTIELGPED